MPRKYLYLFLISILSITLFLQIFSKSQPTIHTIELSENGFTPNKITIRIGDSVLFKSKTGKPFWPASDLHPTHGIYPEFDPQQPIDPSQTWVFKFDKTGIWRFHDHLDPYMTGVITVK